MDGKAPPGSTQSEALARAAAMIETLNAAAPRIEAAREAVAKIPPQKPTDIFDDLYARLPPSLEIQRTAIGEADYD